MTGGIRTSTPVRLARALRWSGAAVVLAVAAFHLEILIARLADATIARPEVALRWVASAVLIAVANELRRRSVLLSGRTAWVLALAVLLLHLGAPPAPSTPALAGLLASLPVGVALACAAWVAAPRAIRRHRRPRGSTRRSGRPAAVPRLGSLSCRFVPRPPPLLVAEQ